MNIPRAKRYHPAAKSGVHSTSSIRCGLSALVVRGGCEGSMVTGDGIHLSCIKQVRSVFSLAIQGRDRQNTDAFVGERGQQSLVPAFVLSGQEGVQLARQPRNLLLWSQTVRTGPLVSRFVLLQQSG